MFLASCAPSAGEDASTLLRETLRSLRYTTELELRSAQVVLAPHDAADEAVGFRFVRKHPIVAVDVAFDPIERLARRLGEDVVEALAHAQYLARLNLHVRSGTADAAARFVQLAARFQSQVRVARDAKIMDGKSIMGILLLAAARGTTITISADGADEQAAVAALAALVDSGFGEAPWNG